MQTEYTLDFILENRGCFENRKIENLFPKEIEVISYKDILQSNIPLEDKYWFFCERVFTNSQNQHIAIKIAECVLPIYEEKYPDDTRPNKAIEAAKLYLSGEIGKEELAAAWSAACACTSACGFVCVFGAAWSAACACTSVAVADADADCTADWAIDAAAEAADPKYKKELEQLLITFIEDNK